MRMPSTPAILLNGAFALVAVASIATVGRSILGADQAVSCRERYSNTIQWTLQRDSGELFSSFDLQARLGSTDWGLIDRVSVVRADNSRGAAFVVDLARPSKSEGSRSAASPQPAGAGFEWAPQSIDGPRAGCASYAVRFDPKFSFIGGGRLPGLRGGRANEDREAENAFSTRLAWNDEGKLDVHGHAPGLASRGVANDLGEASITKGRWVAVDQEVVLNTLGRSDGIVRVWLDGRLAIENRGVAFRTDAASGIRGILAEVAYARQPLQADPNAQVAISPFEFRW